MSISVVILNYNREQFVVDCVKSIYATVFPFKDIVVVDNDSKDQSVHNLRKELAEVKILQAGKNLGYTGGMNIGLRYALETGADYVLVINSDTLVEKQAISILLKEMEKMPNVGAASGTIRYYPEQTKVWYAGGDLIYWRASAFSRHKLPKLTKENERVSFLSGCSILFRVELLSKVGLFDERYFMYNEDAELSTRFIAQGYDLIYVPDAVFYHRIEKEIVAPIQVYYGTRNRLLFLKTTPSIIEKLFGRIYFMIVLTVKLFIWRMTSPVLFRAATWGVEDYFASRFYEGRGLTLK